MSEDDFIDLIDDDAGPEAGEALVQPVWRILVVDDDEEVHAATRYALSNAIIQGRSLRLVHANSGAEAAGILKNDQDFAVIILDVVMETENAGLEMVGRIRKEFAMTECRIILRTGQPGYAPELSVFNQYDINDYRTKSEFTQTRLITAITAAVRSYEQIRSIAENRRGLELIVHAASDLMERRAITAFAEGVLTQVASLLKLPLDGIVCAQRGAPFGENDIDQLFVVGAAGRLASHIFQPLNAIGDVNIAEAIRRTFEARAHLFTEKYTVLYLKSDDQEGVVFVDTTQILAEMDRSLLEVFASNLSACFGNIKLVEKLNFTAYHDQLTGLPNRSAFIRALDQFAQPENDAEKADSVISLVDIEHFADLNDGLGQDIGDAFLMAVGERLQNALGGSCYVSRVGGDVFGLVGPEPVINPESIYKALDELIVINEYQLPVNVTLGFCRFNIQPRERSGIGLLKRASIALNLAKKNRYSQSGYFYPELEEATEQRLKIIRHLHDDFRAKKLSVWFQPQISLPDGNICGLEALLRWPDGHGGFVQPPGVFIPLAEYSGLIIDIGEWVLSEACLALQRLQKIPGAPMRVAVNVSMPQFRMRDFAERVKRTTLEHGISPDAIELEITESLAMDEPKLVISTLQSLKAAGFRIAIDDFGTGYSSLGHLRSLPIDCLKVDRTFVMDLDNERGQMLAETIVALGQRLGVSTVAEGVETEGQAEMLRGMGCGTAQGFLYGKPMGFDDLIPWLEKRV